MNLLYQRVSLGSLVVFSVRSLLADSDHQTDKRGCQNLREKGEERKKETFREMVVLLK